MPHIIVEGNKELKEKVDFLNLLKILVNSLALVDSYELNKIKGRAYFPDTFYLGDKHFSHFLHITLNQYKGRNMSVIEEALNVLVSHTKEILLSSGVKDIKITCKVTDIDPDRYKIVEII